MSGVEIFDHAAERMSADSVRRGPCNSHRRTKATGHTLIGRVGKSHPFIFGFSHVLLSSFLSFLLFRCMIIFYCYHYDTVALLTGFAISPFFRFKIALYSKMFTFLITPNESADSFLRHASIGRKADV